MSQTLHKVIEHTRGLAFPEMAISYRIFSGKLWCHIRRRRNWCQDSETYQLNAEFIKQKTDKMQRSHCKIITYLPWDELYSYKILQLLFFLSFDFMFCACSHSCTKCFQYEPLSKKNKKHSEITDKLQKLTPCHCVKKEHDIKQQLCFQITDLNC